MKKCKMKNCKYENLTKGPFCHNCTSNIRVWSKRPLSHLLKRQTTLEYYGARMAFVKLKFSGPKK